MKNLLISCSLLFMAVKASSQGSLKIVATKNLHFEVKCPNAITYASVVTAGDTLLIKFPTLRGTATITDVQAAQRYKVGSGNSGDALKIPQENMVDAIHVVEKGVYRKFVKNNVYGWY